MMIILNDYQSNVGRDVHPGSDIAQGDFPTKVRSIETRKSYMEPELNREGSLEDGTSMEQGLYELDPITNPEEMYHGI